MKLLLLILFVFSFDSHAKKYHFFFGAGGEPTGKTTIFDKDIIAIKDFVNDSTWDSEVLFNGGHSETERLIDKNLKTKKSKKRFTYNEFATKIKQLENDIRSGKITSKDKLLLNFSTHGGEKNGVGHDLSLAKSTNPIENALSPDTVSSSYLKPLLKLAKEKNIKIAVLDFSCFSGNSQDLADGHACVISSAGPTQSEISGAERTFDFFGYQYNDFTAFSREFYNQLKDGNNLEEVFLSARLKDEKPNFPMISSEEGSQVYRFMYDRIYPYLIFDHENSQDLSRYYDNLFLNYNCRPYEEENKNFKAFETILKKLKQNRNELYNSVMNQEFDPFVSKFLYELRRYKNNHDKYVKKIKAFAKLNSFILDFAKKNRNLIKKEQLDQFTNPVDVLTFDYEKKIKKTKNLIDELKKVGLLDSIFLENYEFLKSVKKFSQKLKSKLDQDYKKVIAEYEQISEEGIQNSINAAIDVGTSSKAVYNYFYNKEKRKTKKSNPCRDFVL